MTVSGYFVNYIHNAPFRLKYSALIQATLLAIQASQSSQEKAVPGIITRLRVMKLRLQPFKKIIIIEK